MQFWCGIANCLLFCILCIPAESTVSYLLLEQDDEGEELANDCVYGSFVIEIHKII